MEYKYRLWDTQDKKFIEDSDRIAVLPNGKVVQIGPNGLAWKETDRYSIVPYEDYSKVREVSHVKMRTCLDALQYLNTKIEWLIVEVFYNDDVKEEWHGYNINYRYFKPIYNYIIKNPISQESGSVKNITIYGQQLTLASYSIENN